MPIRSEQELRDRASEFRELAAAGGDIPLRDGLLEVADEFDREAARFQADASDHVQLLGG